MLALRTGLHRLRNDDGMGILEVVFALIIFMVVATGIAYSAISSLRLSSDSEARVIATNLAASEIDSARANGDPLTLFDATRVVRVDNLDYTVRRQVEWVDSTGTTSGCTGTGALQFKAVDVKVDWSTKLAATSPVRSNTLIAPVTRINDPSYGTLLVSVLSAAGTGMAGIPVAVAQTTGGAPVVMSNTDADGCSYAFGVTPGTYTVTLSKAQYISNDQLTAPVKKNVEIKAGNTVSAPFQYDLAGTFNLKMANTSTATGIRFPYDLTSTFVNTYGVSIFATPVVTGNTSPVKAHPFATGYAAFAGRFSSPTAASGSTPADLGCLAPDPTTWAAGSAGAVAVKAGERAASSKADPGASTDLNVPMGVVTFKYTGATGRYLNAQTVSPPAGSGNPGCLNGLTYRYAMSLTSGSTYSVALPFGSWSLFAATVVNGTGTVSPVTDALSGSAGTTSASVANVVTLDPRLPL
jgi:type II secretory pathway pseudopilin PulG